MQDGKDWGPLKPIRKVPKPGEERMQSTLAVATMPQVADVETKTKLGLILGLVGLVVIIGGGTAAFVFFGKKTDDSKLNDNANSVAVLSNANTNRSVFPEGNSNVNQAVNQNVNTAGNVNTVGNVNAAGNVNQAIVPTTADTDKDGIFDQDELYLGTDPAKTDTDGDGYSDSSELRKGYSPVSTAELTVANYHTYCTAMVGGDVPFATWTSSERETYCTNSETATSRLLPQQRSLDTAAFTQLVGDEINTTKTFCTELFSQVTNEQETKAKNCVFSLSSSFAVFFQLPAS
jgi:hypothetical protein